MSYKRTQISQIFVKGVIGICRQCGGEVKVNQHVLGVARASDGVVYQLAHPCGYREERLLDLTTHGHIIKWFKHVAQGHEESSLAVSPDDKLLESFHDQIELAGEQLVAAFTD